MKRTCCHPSLQIRPSVLICLFLVLSTLSVYWQLRNYDFIVFDDQQYVEKNKIVREGLTFKGVQWAFTTGSAANWHPVTWLSHMADVELYGVNPGYHHMTNVIFHILNAVLLFLTLKMMTGAVWKSGFVAALFALHPLHVESVAWISERKDVLSTFFWMLALLSYVRYAKGPGVKRYLMVLVWFILGLMSKPMVVTLPFVLLILDYWPLNRFEFSPETANPFKESRMSSVANLVYEKVPFFLLSALSCVITFIAQYSGNAVSSLKAFPLYLRLGNSLNSYIAYLAKIFRPDHLAVFYPYQDALCGWAVIGSGIIVSLICWLSLRYKIKYPWLPAGWLWYVITLVPVIGIVQVGLQSMADRYTYVPAIGIFILLTWGIPELLGTWRFKKQFLAVGSTALLSVCMMLSYVQAGYWENSMKLFSHALDVTEDNYVVHEFIGVVFARDGRFQDGIYHYQKALAIHPKSAQIFNRIGLCMLHLEKYDEAIDCFLKALAIKPDDSMAHNNLGVVFALKGKYEEAVSHFCESLRTTPDDAGAMGNLKRALLKIDTGKH